MWSVIIIHVCAWVVLGAARALPRLRCAASARMCNATATVACCTQGTVRDKLIVDGNSVSIKFLYSQYTNIKVECSSGTLTLDSPSMPRFDSTVYAKKVTLSACAPPADSYARALAALNVTMLANATLILSNLPPPPATPLAAAHLSGLPPINLLKLENVAPAADFLSRLNKLRQLKVFDGSLPDNALDQLQDKLKALQLSNTSVKRVPERTMLSLQELSVSEMNEVRLEGKEWPKLQNLVVDIPGPAVILRCPQLKILHLVRVHAEKLAPLNQCEMLYELKLLNTWAKVLPPSWLATCAQLRIVAIDNAGNITEIPSTLFANLTKLERLTIRRTNISTLPVELFKKLTKLTYLDLKENKLKTLPRELFSGTRALQELDLSYNEFDAKGLDSLNASLLNLNLLNLDYNERLGNVCTNANGTSVMNNLTNLTKLSLQHTGVTLICRDWREGMLNLSTLDLSNTKVSTLTYHDLLYRRTVLNALVFLKGAPVDTISYNESDFLNVSQASTNSSQATVVLDAKRPTLVCSCSLYWAVRALHNKSGHVTVDGLVCGNASRPPLRGRKLREVDIKEFVCEAPEICKHAASCTCTNDINVVQMSCENAALTSLPPPPDSNATFDWMLANNNISELRTTDLPPNLRNVDLRNNSLVRVNAKTVKRLVTTGRRLRLSGNPLACDCDAAALLSALSQHEDNVIDYKDLKCPDGKPLTAEPRPPCEPPAPHVRLAVTLGAVLAAFLAALLVLAGCLASPTLRMLIKVFLFRYGWLPRVAEPDDERPFDVFISFSHEDEIIVKELVTRLEDGPAPYRLCLHYRHWTPGRSIPEQIAESIGASRRTLALVSRHFLRSAWARAEFREAYANALIEVTPRLVALLLEEPNNLPLDMELRRYLKGNTYLRWGDPWFWEKLQLALPLPRAPIPKLPQSPLPCHSVSFSLRTLRNDSTER